MNVDAANNRLLVEYTPNGTQYELNEDGTLKPLDGGIDLGGGDVTNVGALDTDELNSAIESPSDISASRSVDTAYQNTTGHNLLLSVIFASDGSQEIDVRIGVSSSSAIGADDTVDRFQIHASDISDFIVATVDAEIPPDHYYQVSTGFDHSATLEKWDERGRKA